MDFPFQEVIVVLIVLAAACYVGRRFYRKISGRERPPCCAAGESCDKCSRLGDPSGPCSPPTDRQDRSNTASGKN
ncbi:MAG: FeoB-associated Cys-rich membrane protein [Desulfobacteraceae bacterium]